MNLPISRLGLLDCRRNSFVLEPNHSSHALFDGKSYLI